MNVLIFIKQLNVDTRIGLLEWEKLTRQVLKFDIEVETDIKLAGNSDNINDTVNYASISNEIIRFCDTQDNDLIETLAENVCRHLFSCFNIFVIRLSIAKIGVVKEAHCVGLKIERTASDYA